MAKWIKVTDKATGRKEWANLDLAYRIEPVASGGAMLHFGGEFDWAVAESAEELMETRGTGAGFIKS